MPEQAANGHKRRITDAGATGCGGSVFQQRGRYRGLFGRAEEHRRDRDDESGNYENGSNPADS